jgi:hypothetical protein
MTTRTDPAPVLTAFVAVDESTHSFPIHARGIAPGDFVIVGRFAYRVTEVVADGRDAGLRTITFADGDSISRGAREMVHVVERDVIDEIVEHAPPAGDVLAPKREQDEPEVGDLNALRLKRLELDRELGALNAARLVAHPSHVEALDRLYDRGIEAYGAVMATIVQAETDEQAAGR